MQETHSFGEPFEARLTGLGFAGSAKHKYMQGYSPLSHVLKAAGEYEMRQPQTMKSLRGRKQGLINLVDIVCCNLDKVGGCRLEVRVRGEPGLSLADAIAAGKKQITSLLELLGRDIQVKKVKVSDYRDFVKQELAAAMAANVFRGMRDTGPTEEQRDLFHQKVVGWSTLVSNIGFVSGHFARAELFLAMGPQTKTHLLFQKKLGGQEQKVLLQRKRLRLLCQRRQGQKSLHLLCQRRQRQKGLHLCARGGKGRGA